MEAAGDSVVLVDLRWALDGSVGRDDYLDRHLPGAVYADLNTVAAGPPTPTEGRHPLPDPAEFARTLGELGIDVDDTVVAYDQGPGIIAARLVWLLRSTGQAAAVLKGGLAAWPGPIESGEVSRPAVSRPQRPWPAPRLADADLTADLAARSGTVVVDARDPSRFTGEFEPVDRRAGHVPGAVNLPAADDLDPEGNLLPTDALRRRYRETGILDAPDVVAYCGSGVTACHSLLVMESLGVVARLFPGSWSAWSADPDRQVATGP